jgi:DNA mismatch repair protein MutS2
MAEQAFKAGSHVTILALKKAGIVAEVLPNGRYKVAVGALTLTVPRDGLIPNESPKSDPTHTGNVARSRRGGAQGVKTSIDLHGFTVDHAVHALEEWLNKAILAGHSQLQVVHGLGSGKVQRAVHEALSRYGAVRAFRLNDRNPGMTDVFIG